MAWHKLVALAAVAEVLLRGAAIDATAELSGQSDVEPSCTIKIEFDAEVQLGDPSNITIFDVDASAVYQTIDVKDLDRVIIQGNVMLIIPRPGLGGGRTYEVTLLADSVQSLASDFTFSFTTRPLDSVKPAALFFWPPGSKERGTNTVDDNPPYVQFSEAVAAVVGKKITFQSGQTVQYTLDAADDSCGTGGSLDDGCVVLNSFGTRATLYPRGLRSPGSVLPAPWSSPGFGYRITVEDGAFKDALAPLDAVGNSNDAIVFSDRVSSDSSAPAIVHGDPGSMSEGFALDATTQSVFLTFDEILYPGDGGISIKARTAGGPLPPRLLVDEAGVTTRSLGPKGVVVLSFDQAVQAGTGQLEVFRSGVQTPVVQVDPQDAYYVDNKVIITGSLTDHGVYYAEAHGPGAILSTSGVPMDATLDTESSVVYELNSDSEGPKLVWSTADGFNCYPSDGRLPDFRLVMDQELDTVNNGNVELFDESDNLLWSLVVRTELGLDISTPYPFEATLRTGNLGSGIWGAGDRPLVQGGRYTLRVQAGVLQRSAINGLAGTSPEMTITFGICEVQFSNPSSKLLRVYSPYMFSASSETMDSETSGAMSYSVTFAEMSLMDALGNYYDEEMTYEFGQDLSPPALDPASCNPPAGGYGSPYENIVIAFNEVVQAGSGALQLWSVEDGEIGLAFQVDVTSLEDASVNGHSPISGRKASITPKTFCNPSYGSCTDLPEGLYSIRTVDMGGNLAAGVFLDVLGNPLPAMDTDDHWTFSIQKTDAVAPEVAFVAGSELIPASGIYPSELRAYVYFTERLELISGGDSAVFINCGADFDCATSADNSPPDVAVASVGTGTGAAGLDDYGMLVLSRTKMPTNTRYQVVLPPGLVSDYAPLGGARAGPSSSYTFEIEVGTVPALPTDVVHPYLVAKEPKNAARKVAIDATMVLYFSEDIVIGSGVVQLCTNSNAQVGSCNVATLSDGSLAQVDIADATFDRRTVTVGFPSTFDYGSVLYVLIPKGVVRDLAGNDNTAVERSMYVFNVVAQDGTPPSIDFMDFPAAASGNLVLLFNEAVRRSTPTDDLQISPDAGLGLTWEYTGNAVIATSSNWDPSITYTLTLPIGIVEDYAGNAFPDAQQEYTFSISGDPPAPDTTGDVDGPLLNPTGIWSVPEDGARGVIPSASLQLIYNEIVQAGVGPITLHASSGDIEVPLDRCYFDAERVICDPEVDMGQYTTYSVRFAAGLVQDVAGNPSTEALTGSGSPRLSFTTVDLDFTPPFLTAFSPVNGAEGVSTGVVLGLSFSEVVQANTGSFLLMDCSPGQPGVCFDGATETTADTLAYTIDIDGSTPDSAFIFDGTEVYIEQTLLQEDTRYRVQTSNAGVVTDIAGVPLGELSSGWEFTTERPDTTPPTVNLYSPVGFGAPGADIVLTFSEPVEKAGSGHTISIALAGATIDFDPDDPAAYFQVSGPTVTMRPPVNLPYDDTADLIMPSGMLKDYAGNAFAGISSSEFTWQTPSSSFESLATSAAFSPRQGASLHYVQDRLLLFGGKGGSCYSDAFVSEDGTSWTQVAPSSAVPSAVDQAATATDKDGCMWLLGGQCDGEGTSSVWRTCTLGESWQQFASPTSLIAGIPWPDSFSGHAIAILGGWQLVVLDAQNADFWAFTDRTMTSVARTATALPFGRRAGPTMLSTSGNDIYVIGGEALGGDVMMDIWKSSGDTYTMFVGSRWRCQTADYRVGMASPDATIIASRNIGMAMTGDDTLFFVAGQPADTDTGTNSVFSWAASMSDESFGQAILTTYADGVVSIYFDEAVEIVDPTKVRLLDMAEGTSMGYEVSVARQILLLTATSSALFLDDFKTYQVVIEDGALADSSGNLVEGFPGDYTSDGFVWDRRPSLVSVLPQGEGVAPWTHLVLKMSENVEAGAGSLQLTCAAGADFSLPVADATISESSALFKLPSGSRLMPGQLYTIHIPEGLFVDHTHQALPADSGSTFRVLSGVASASSDGYSGSAFPTVDPASFSASADVLGSPTLVSVSPRAGATDVPTTGAAVVFTFSEQVIIDSQGTVVAIYHNGALIEEYTEASVTAGLVSVVSGGIKVSMPTLTAGETYVVRLFAGQAVDLVGNDAPAAEVGFTCLVGTLDTTPPQVAMTYPSEGGSYQAAAIQTLSFWFLEDIAEGAGGIVITTPSGSQSTVVVPSSAVAVDGPLLSVEMPTLPDLQANTRGDYRVDLQDGVVADLVRTTAGGIAEGGGVPLSGQPPLTYEAAHLDTPDIITSSAGGHAMSSSTRVPASATLEIVFDAPVQPGSGSIRLTPQVAGGSSLPVAIPADGDEVVFDGTRVVIAPAADLTLGQDYAVSLDNDAIKSADGLSAEMSGVEFTVAPEVEMERVGAAQFGGTERYAASVAVNPANDIFVVGGADNSGAALGDVWRLKTYRETSCGSALQSMPTCSLTLCTAEPSTLGTWGVEPLAPETVWRSPSSAGRRCISSDGVAFGNIGDVVGYLQGECPCPVCHAPPLPPLPDHIDNETYFDDYVGTSASAGTAPLHCAVGYEATPPAGSDISEFQCLADNWVSGAWQMPYPECSPHACELAPPEVEHQESAVGQPCSSAAPWDPVPHGTVCPMQCEAGYASAAGVGQGSFTCNFGEYTLPSCAPQACPPVPDVPNGNVRCDNAAGSTVSYGNVCSITCDPGFVHSIGTYTFKCDVPIVVGTVPLPEAVPLYTDTGSCEPATCGDLNIADIDPLGVVLSYTSQNYVVGTKANVGCTDGYRPSDYSFSTFVCSVKLNVAGSSVVWVGTLECVRITCTLPEDDNSYFECDGKRQYEDTCQLRCINGRILSGNGTFTCGANGELQGEGSCVLPTCPEPALPENAFSTTCSGAMANGTSCSLTCDKGYTAYGEWVCVEGAYIQTAVCIESGAEAEPAEYVSSGFTFLASFSDGTSSRRLQDVEQVLDSESFQDALENAIADSVYQVQLMVLEILETTDITDQGSNAAVGLSSTDETTIYVRFRLQSMNDTQVLSLLTGDEVSVKARFAGSLASHYSGVSVTSVLLDRAVLQEAWQTLQLASFETGDTEEDSSAVTVVIGSLIGVILGVLLVLAYAYRYHTRSEVVMMVKDATACPRCLCCRKRQEPLLEPAAEPGPDGPFGVTPNLAGPPGAGVGVDVADDRDPL